MIFPKKCLFLINILVSIAGFNSEQAVAGIVSYRTQLLCQKAPGLPTTAVQNCEVRSHSASQGPRPLHQSQTSQRGQTHRGQKSLLQSSPTPEEPTALCQWQCPPPPTPTTLQLRKTLKWRCKDSQQTEGTIQQGSRQVLPTTSQREASPTPMWR